MAQLVTRIDQSLASEIDELVAEGVFESRSDAVRRGLRNLISEHVRRQTAEAIISGYEKLPQTEHELGWSDESSRRMISEEPW